MIRLMNPAFKTVSWHADTHAVSSGGGGSDVVAIAAGAGTNMARLTLDTVLRGYAGLECMAGIPGTLGGILA